MFEFFSILSNSFNHSQTSVQRSTTDKGILEYRFGVSTQTKLSWVPVSVANSRNNTVINLYHWETPETRGGVQL